MSSPAESKAVRDRLAMLTVRGGGVLRPEAVVADARDEDSPLHKHFEWDQEKGHYANLLNQARALIRSVKVTVTTETKTVRTVAYTRDPDAAPDQQGYVPVATLMTETDRARSALVAEFSAVAARLRRAQDLAAVLGMSEGVIGAIENIEMLRRQVAPVEEQPGIH